MSIRGPVSSQRWRAGIVAQSASILRLQKKQQCVSIPENQAVLSSSYSSIFNGIYAWCALVSKKKKSYSCSSSMAIRFFSTTEKSSAFGIADSKAQRSSYVSLGTYSPESHQDAKDGINYIHTLTEVIMTMSTKKDRTIVPHITY